jgi:hypothetical protein
MRAIRDARNCSLAGFFTPYHNETPMPEQDSSPTVTFHLSKTPDFQTHHADGILTGLSPGRKVFLAFYTERPPIPTAITHRLDAEGALGEAVDSTGKQGVVREIHTGITLSMDTLEKLEAHIRLLKNQLAATP